MTEYVICGNVEELRVSESSRESHWTEERKVPEILLSKVFLLLFALTTECS